MNTYTGIFLFRRKPNLQLLLAHPGGPEWDGKEEGVWTIPLSAPTGNMSAIDAARKAFEESFGFIPEGEYVNLDSYQQNSQQAFQTWAAEYQLPDDFIFDSYWYEIEWPPDSGKTESFPEFDRLEYFPLFEASQKLIPALRLFIPRLINKCID